MGGTGAALHAHHRVSFDHDHLPIDLSDRYADIVAAVEASDGWVTSVRASSSPFTLLGSLDGVEAGLRQLRRTTALEVMEFPVGDGHTVRAPTLEEMLRVKAYLVVNAMPLATTWTPSLWHLVSVSGRRCGSLAASTVTTPTARTRGIRC